MEKIINFLQNKMSMTEVYQPVIIKELLLNNGFCTKTQLAQKLAEYDFSVVEYYKQILMRWPKTTLTNHGIILYDRRRQLFEFKDFSKNLNLQKEAIKICDQKITDWLDKKEAKNSHPEENPSIRYEVLKRANGKCQLCGIPSSLRPIDIDHVVPRSKADRNKKVRLKEKIIGVDSIENLQALCFKCNRAKRDSDETDFRRTKKLVRDRIPDIIKKAGRAPIVKKLSGERLTEALYEKLIEEHEEFINEKTPSKKIEELADIIEVAIAIAEHFDIKDTELFKIVIQKRNDRGGFSEGFFYEGDEGS